MATSSGAIWKISKRAGRHPYPQSLLHPLELCPGFKRDRLHSGSHPVPENEAWNRWHDSLRKARYPGTFRRFPGTCCSQRRLSSESTWADRSGKICHGCFLLPGRAGRKRTHCLGTVPGRIAVKMPGISSKKGDFTQCVSSPSFF